MPLLHAFALSLISILSLLTLAHEHGILHTQPSAAVRSKREEQWFSALYTCGHELVCKQGPVVEEQALECKINVHDLWDHPHTCIPTLRRMGLKKPYRSKELIKQASRKRIMESVAFRLVVFSEYTKPKIDLFLLTQHKIHQGGVWGEGWVILKGGLFYIKRLSKWKGKRKLGDRLCFGLILGFILQFHPLYSKQNKTEMRKTQKFYSTVFHQRWDPLIKTYKTGSYFAYAQ